MSTPVTAPDPTKIDGAATTVATEVGPFIPAKVRAVIYSVGSAAGATLEAISPVVGGEVGTVLQIIGAALAAFVGAVAISHVSGK